VVDGGIESAAELDRLIAQYHGALSEFMTRDPDPAIAFFSHRDDVTLGTPARVTWGNTGIFMRSAATSTHALHPLQQSPRPACDPVRVQQR